MFSCHLQELQQPAAVLTAITVVSFSQDHLLCALLYQNIPQQARKRNRGRNNRPLFLGSEETNLAVIRKIAECTGIFQHLNMGLGRFGASQ